MVPGSVSGFRVREVKKAEGIPWAHLSARADASSANRVFVYSGLLVDWREILRRSSLRVRSKREALQSSG